MTYLFATYDENQQKELERANLTIEHLETLNSGLRDRVVENKWDIENLSYRANKAEALVCARANEDCENIDKVKVLETRVSRLRKENADQTWEIRGLSTKIDPKTADLMAKASDKIESLEADKAKLKNVNADQAFEIQRMAKQEKADRSRIWEILDEADVASNTAAGLIDLSNNYREQCESLQTFTDNLIELFNKLEVTNDELVATNAEASAKTLVHDDLFTAMASENSDMRLENCDMALDNASLKHTISDMEERARNGDHEAFELREANSVLRKERDKADADRVDHMFRSDESQSACKKYRVQLDRCQEEKSYLYRKLYGG
jgi:hypothetical protein